MAMNKDHNGNIEQAANIATMSHEDLQAVAGGALSCNQALALSSLYKTLGDIQLNVFGSPAGAAAYYGRSQGVIEGSCPK
jgi:hypothetical protein